MNVKTTLYRKISIKIVYPFEIPEDCTIVEEPRYQCNISILFNDLDFGYLFSPARVSSRLLVFELQLEIENEMFLWRRFN